MCVCVCVRGGGGEEHNVAIQASIMKALKCKPSAYIFLHVHLSLYVRTGVYGKYKLVIYT